MEFNYCASLFKDKTYKIHFVIKIMKKQKKQKEEYEIKWWKEWLEADMLKKEEMVNKLPIAKSIWNLKNLPKKMRERIFAQTLNGLFEDLENAVYTKVRNKKG